MARRTDTQKFANEIDADLHTLWIKLLDFDPFGTEIAHLSRDPFLCARQMISLARDYIRPYMHERDRKGRHHA